MGALDEPRRLWDGKRGAARQGGVYDLSSRPLTRPVDAEATRSDTATRAVHRSGGVPRQANPASSRPSSPSPRISSAMAGGWFGYRKSNVSTTTCDRSDRVTAANIVEYVDELRRLNASSTVTSRIRHLYCVLRVMASDRDWTWLRDVESRLRKSTTNARDKAARVKSTSELFAYGVELMERAEGPSGGTRFQRAQGFRDGLIIVLLAARPLRRRNVAAIEIGRHLIRQGEDYCLKFSAKEIKTRRAIAMPFPSVLVPFPERYLSQHRPLLNPVTRGGRWVAKNPQPRPQTAALWISTHGTPMAATTIYARVIALTTAKFGHSVNPHLFRDSAATSVATEDPAHVHIVKDLLGHSTLKTSERYYMHAQATEAIPRHQNGILALRRQSRDGRYAASCRET